MHYGNSHTTEPRQWIEKFDKKYKMLSVVLSVAFEECIKRAVGRNEHPLEVFDALHQYFLFYAKYQNIFKSKAQVEEIQVDSKDNNPQQVFIVDREIRVSSIVINQLINFIYLFKTVMMIEEMLYLLILDMLIYTCLISGKHLFMNQ